MLATKCVFAFGLFDKDAKLTLPVIGTCEGETIHGFTVEVMRNGESARCNVVVNKTNGSIDVVRSQLHEYVDEVCDVYEKGPK
jgi:methyl coenzyme M reductase gamma subunit